MKLQTKLTLFNTVSKLFIVVLFVLLLPNLVEEINRNYIDNRLLKQEEQVLHIIGTKGIEEYMPDGTSYGSYTLLKEEYIGLDVVPLTDFQDTIETAKRIIDQDTIDYRVLSHTFKLGNKNYLLEIGKSIKTINETSSPLQSIALEVLLGMILLTILADLFYTNYILRPLGLIIKAKLLGRNFPTITPYQRIKTTTYDFKYLDESIHQMIEHIESAFQKEREFISNASHELMTPISILQNKIENLSDRDDISDEMQLRFLEMQKTLNRLKSITKTLLLISQIENEQFFKEDIISVKEILAEVYDEISIRLQDKNLTLTIDVPKDKILMNVNRFLLFNLFFNLVNNAIKYNKPFGDIYISGIYRDDNFILEFKDTGNGISEDDLPHIFNRFKKFRQSAEQDSFGLGLPIVRSIADFHKIDIEVESVIQVGTTFRLIFK